MPVQAVGASFRVLLSRRLGLTIRANIGLLSLHIADFFELGREKRHFACALKRYMKQWWTCDFHDRKVTFQIKIQAFFYAH